MNLFIILLTYYTISEIIDLGATNGSKDINQINNKTIIKKDNIFSTIL